MMHQNGKFHEETIRSTKTRIQSVCLFLRSLCKGHPVTELSTELGEARYGYNLVIPSSGHFFVTPPRNHGFSWDDTTYHWDHTMGVFNILAGDGI